jgi:glyoxylase-like metal-dependent hydrolase (beta-lactamase superfamily II)
MVKAIINEYTENTYIINEKLETFIIDPGANFSEIKAYITEKNFIVKGILLTHGHFDHLYSINEVENEYKCDIYIYETERDFLFDPNLNLSSSLNTPISLKHKNRLKLIKHNDELILGREKIKVLHTPGHTRGGVCYKYKRFLFSGDTLFKGTIGRYDLPTSNKAQLRRSLELIIKECRDNTVVYPGHGHFTTILNEKHENPFLDFARK